MTTRLRIRAGVAVALGLLLAGAARQPAALAQAAPGAAAPAVHPAPPAADPAPAPAAAAQPPAAAPPLEAWRAAARKGGRGGKVTPSAVVRAAARSAPPARPACPPEGEQDPACAPGQAARATVEIDWNAPLPP
ncbi:MAG: hypothetical protein QM767_21805 [Anaeromyxobacter sp.]